MFDSKKLAAKGGAIISLDTFVNKQNNFIKHAQTKILSKRLEELGLKKEKELLIKEVQKNIEHVEKLMTIINNIE